MTAELSGDKRLRDRLLTLLRSTEPLRNLNTTALTDAADQMLLMAERVGWTVRITDTAEELLSRPSR